MRESVSPHAPRLSTICARNLLRHRHLARIFPHERRFARLLPLKRVTFAQIQFVHSKTAQYPSHPKAGRLTARCFAPRARALGLSHRAAIHPGFGRVGHCHGEISGRDPAFAALLDNAVLVSFSLPLVHFSWQKSLYWKMMPRPAD
jgi:hypothetical protein